MSQNTQPPTLANPPRTAGTLTHQHNQFPGAGRDGPSRPALNALTDRAYRGISSRRVPPARSSQRLGALLIAPDDTEVVAGWVDLIVAAAVSGHKVEVDAAVGATQVVDFDEQQPMTAPRVDDHALLIARLIRVARDVGLAEDSLPPLRQLERSTGLTTRSWPSGTHGMATELAIVSGVMVGPARSHSGKATPTTE